MKLGALCFLIALATASCSQQNKEVNPWDQVPEILGKISEPSFPDKEYNILNFGAVPDGITLNTKAINKTIEECAQNGGGTVIIPDGTFFTGSIHLKSNIRLHLSDSAILIFSVNPTDYTPLVYTRWEGIDCYNYSPLIYAINVENIAITGKGLLQGNSTRNDWWPWKGQERHGWKEGMPSQLLPNARPMLDTLNKYKVPAEERIAGDGFYLRPQFINIVQSKNVLISDVTIENSPFWVIHPMFVENLIVRNVTINSLGPNNDGCNPESCKNVLIDNCFFNTGDDCIAIKSGRNNDGIIAAIPSENIIVRNCQMKNGHGGVVIGSEVSGGTRNVFVEDCIMDSPHLQRAIRLKTNSNRGGIIENLYVRNVTVGQVSESVLHINCIYDIRKEGSDTLYPIIRNVYLEQVTSQKSRFGISVEGIEGKDIISNIRVSDCNFQGVEKNNRLEHAGEIILENVIINEETLNSVIKM